MKDNSTRNLIIAMAVMGPLTLGGLIAGEEYQQSKIGTEVIELVPEKVFDAKDVGNGVVKYAYYSDTEQVAFQGEDINKRTPTSWTKTQGKDRNGEDLGNGKEEITLFSQGAFVKMNTGKWHTTEFATTTKEKFELQKDKTQINKAQEVGMYGFIRTASAQTYYPDPNPESTSVDGYVLLTSTTYSTVHDASTGAAVSDTDVGSGNAHPQHSKFSTTYYIGRDFYLFDTSSLDDGASISSATFSVYSDGNYSDADNDTWELVSSNPASNTGLATDDYDQLGTTSFGSFDPTSAGAGYYNITVNATGISAISKTGITKYGLRYARDIANTAPTGLNQGTSRFADYTGTDSDPKLVITVSAGGTPSYTTGISGIDFY